MTETSTLINMICAMTDPIAALNDTPVTPDDARLYYMICNVYFGGRSLTEDEIDALIDLALTHAPITFRANHRYNYTPLNSTIVNLDMHMAIVHDYCLN